MVKKRRHTGKALRLLLALMMAVPQSWNVFAEGEETEPAEEITEITESEEPAETEVPEEEIIVPEEETAEPAEEETPEEPETEVTPETEPEETGEEAQPEEETGPSVTLNVSEVELQIGESYTFEAVLSGAEEETPVWTVGDETVVSVDENGTVTALKEGVTTVRVSVLDGTVYAEALVKVPGTETGPVIFQETSYEVVAGESITIPYEFDGAAEDIVWSVSEENIVTLDTDTEGEVTVEALESGIVTVYAEVADEKSLFGVVVLPEHLNEDMFAEAEEGAELMATGTTVTASYNVNYNQTSARELSGLVNAYRYNSAHITTLIYDYTIEKYAMQRAAELAARFKHVRPDGSEWHTVFDKAKYGNPSTSNLTENLLYAGDGTMNTAGQVFSYVMGNNTQRTNAMRSVNKAFGIGHAEYNGIHYWVMLFSDRVADTTPTSSVNGSKTVTVKIGSDLYSNPTFSASKSTVKVNVNKSVSLPSLSGTVRVSLGGQTKTVSISNFSATWTLDSAGQKYASISKGKVEAGSKPNNDEKAYLVASITMNGSRYTVKVELKVIQPVTGVTLEPKEKSIDVGETYPLTATVKPSNATDKSVTWKSSNTKIATVSSKGVVTAKKGGKATITVTTNDGGFKATSTITVIVHADRIAFEFDELTMSDGMTDKLVPVFYPKDTTDQRVTFKSSDTEKVLVQEDGTIIALEPTEEDKPVIVTMTAVENTKLTADLPVTVKDKDAVLEPYATSMYDAKYEYYLYPYDPEEEEDDFTNTIVKGDEIFLHCDTKDAEIYYTLDGTDPVADPAQKYTGMFRYPGGDLTLKVMAVKPNRMKGSEIEEYRMKEVGQPVWEIEDEDLAKLPYREIGEEEKIYEIPVGLWAAGAEESAAYTGSKITFPDIRVYYRNQRLAIGTDYKISYKNNVNVCPEGTKACTWTQKDDGSYKPASGTKVAYVQISGKGNYKGSAYIPFKITPVAITEDNGFSYQNELYLSLGKKALKPVPVILWNGKKLKNKTDYVVAYSRDPEGTEILEGGITEEGDYYAIISGIKNFTFESDKLIAVPIHVKAEAKLLSKAKVKVANVEYSGKPLDPETLVITAKYGKTELIKGTDYVIESVNPEIDPEEPTEIGTYTVTLKAAENSDYLGTVNASFKITGKQLSKAKVYCMKSSVVYTGNTFTLDELFAVNPSRPALDHVALYYGSDELKEGEDYTVEISGQNKGKGTVKFTGMGEYTGTIKKTFTINARTLKKDDVDIYTTDINFSKSGAKADVYVFLKTDENDPMAFDYTTDDDGNPVWGRVLEVGKDFTLKYFNNKKMYTDSEFKTKNPPSVSVIFKGNYKGTIAGNHFLIQSEDISFMPITAADIVYSASKKGSQYYVKPVIYDYQGKKLTLNKDYNLKYYYAQDAKVNGSDTVNRAYGTALRATDTPEPGTVIAVEATGIGSYYGTLKAEYKVIKKAANLSSAKVTMNYYNGKNKYFEYTGEQIVPTADNMTVKLGKTELVFGEDFVIESLKNNTKAGKATMVLRGINEYGGTKKVTFSIGKQSLFLDLSNLLRGLFGGE